MGETGVTGFSADSQAASEKRAYTRSDILAILPHREPFLFVDRVLKLVPGVSIVTERDLDVKEPHFAGHFPGKPVMPGVLVVDALAQTSGLLWGLSKVAAGATPDPEKEMFYLVSVNMKFPHPAHPGDTVRMTARAERVYGAMHTYAVEAAVGRNLIAKGTLTLAMIG